MRRLFFFLFIFFSVNIAFGQKIADIEVSTDPSLLLKNEIPYSGIPLTWEAFQGAPDHSRPFVAMSQTGIRIHFSLKNKNGIPSAKVRLCSYMDISQSWYKKQGKNQATLAHEQRHFDITEIFARKLAAAIKSQDFDYRSFPEEIKKIYAQHLQKLEEMQTAYDQETHHGIHVQKQADWNEKILALLQPE